MGGAFYCFVLQYSHKGGFLWLNLSVAFLCFMLVSFFKNNIKNDEESKPWIFSTRHEQIQWNINHPDDPVEVSDE